jgi:hypothetical protein
VEEYRQAGGVRGAAALAPRLPALAPVPDLLQDLFTLYTNVALDRMCLLAVSVGLPLADHWCLARARQELQAAGLSAALRQHPGLADPEAARLLQQALVNLAVPVGAAVPPPTALTKAEVGLCDERGRLT